MIDELRVQRLIEAMILANRAATPDPRGNLRIKEQLREVKPARLPMLNTRTHFEFIHKLVVTSLD